MKRLSRAANRINRINNYPNHIFTIMSYKKLTKSDDKIFAGICGGMAEYLDFDPTVVRVAYATLTLFTAFSGIILYFVL